MSIPGAASPLFLGAAVAEEAAYQIDRSLRFNSADSAYVNRTPSSAGNRKTWTWSGWVKKININTLVPLFSAGNNPWVAIDILSDQLRVLFNAGSGDVGVSSDALFRDLSAWYHIVAAVDTTQATAADRVKIYSNGVQLSVTANPDGLPSQNSDTLVNSTITHRLGADGRVSGGGIRYGSFYLADVNFIDGQALDPTDFGEYDDNNNWNPKDASGLTFGTNGFHLDFADYSDLGDDNSGNGNDWTPNNLVGLDVRTETTSAFSATGTTHGSISNLLNNDTTNGYGVQNGTLTYTPASAITVSSQIVFHYSTDQSNTRFRVNSGSYITLPDPSGVGTYTHSFSGSLTTIEWNAPSSGELVSVHQIQIDDQILVNPTIAAGNDSLIDTPTNYEADSGNNGGNYCTGNPLSKGSAITLANGNLDISAASSGSQRVWGTIGVSTGKWYFEFSQTSGTYAQAVGIKSSAAQDNSTQYGYHGNTGNKIDASGSTSSYGATWGNNDVIGVAFDLDAGTITFYKNGVSQGQAFSGITDATYFPYVFGWSGGAWGGFVNFGQRPFAYTPPSNHLALVTTNLTDPTIADGSTAMDVVTYTGNGSTQTISGLGFSPDLVWIKRRNSTNNHRIFDVIRGVNKSLSSDLASTAYTPTNQLTAFNSDGFNLGSNNEVNENTGTYVGWSWDAGTTTDTSNTDGSITPTGVRANQSTGTSIVTWTGQSSGSATIGHGLNAAPEFILLKGLTGSVGWTVGHQSIGWTKRLQLNTTAAQSTSSNYWNNTAPTNSVFTSGANNVSNTFVAYCFAPVAGYSKFGSYTGNNSTDGTFVYTGMRPRWILIRAINSIGDWIVWDTARDTYNVAESLLYPNLSSAEQDGIADRTPDVIIDVLSNGFKCRGTNNDLNASEDYLYAAFAEHSFKTARAR